MPVEIVTVPCRTDNYAYLIKDSAADEVLLVDAPEAGPILEALTARRWTLSTILVTHHHGDHVEAVDALRDRYDCEVIGPRAEASKMPALSREVAEGDSGGSGDLAWTVLEVPGHTLGHIAYHFPKAGAVFTADSLMALGCGRVFEGTMEMMHDSLSKLAALPAETVVYSGHEYTRANARFAATVDPDNPALQARTARIEEAREAGRPTAQVPLQEELETNPFLRASDPAIRNHLGMQDATDAEVFAEIRRRKDAF